MVIMVCLYVFNNHSKDMVREWSACVGIRGALIADSLGFSHVYCTFCCSNEQICFEDIECRRPDLYMFVCSPSVLERG